MENSVFEDRVKTLADPDGSLSDASLQIDQHREQLGRSYLHDRLVPKRRRDVELERSDPLRGVLSTARSFDHAIVIGNRPRSPVARV